MYRFLISSLALLAAAYGQNIKTDGVGLAIGGFGGGNSLEVIEYGKTCLSSVSFPAIPNAPAGQLEAWSAEYVDDRIWLCGGADINYHSECYSIGIGDEKWKQEGDLNTAREFAASLVFNGELVMMGGFNDRAGWLDKVDKKEAGTGKWIQMDDWKMPRKMYDHCAVQMDRNHIIVIGGNEYGEDFHSSVDILNTETGVYTSAEPLPVGRASHGCLATHVDGDDGVMVTGGCTDQCQTPLSDTLFFSFRTRSWRQLSPLRDARNGHKMTHIGGRPAVVAGVVGSAAATVGSVHTFDGQNWQTMSASLNFPRWAFGMPTYVPPSAIRC